MRYNEEAMITRNEKETIALGWKLGSLLEKGSVIALKGDLAAGKTTFTKGIAQALHVRQIVNSPTFTILKIYEGDLPLYHVDAYRLEGNDYDLGFSSYEDEGVMVIEWPEYYEAHLPGEYMEVDLNYVDEESRSIDFIGHGEKYEKIAEEMKC